MGHPHRDGICFDGFCGDTLFFCDKCGLCYHDFTFPGEWILWPDEENSDRYNASTPYYKTFCSSVCRSNHINKKNTTKPNSKCQ
jgi:hypothetical protein